MTRILEYKGCFHLLKKIQLLSKSKVQVSTET